uniref:Uncharacterized protein n=1 Tax=Oryza nivara TaxID=4536 RepID=A0A0E0GRR9_ORYNI
MATEYLYDRYNGVYWQGALYVLCQTDFVMRSMRGVHYALIDNEHRLRVSFLNKSCGCQEICIQNDGPWTLHYKNYFGHSSQNGAEEYYEAYKEYITRRYCYEYDNAPYKNHCEDIEKDVVVRVNKFEWDSDNDDIYS